MCVELSTAQVVFENIPFKTWGNGLLLNYKDIFQGYDDTKRDFSHNFQITLFPFLRPDSNSLGMGRIYYLCFNNSSLLQKSTLMRMQ